jgi:hypothetical protein
MLVLCCVMLLGIYFCYDNPTPLQQTLVDNPPYNLSPVQFTSLYSIYALPNMILPVFSGLFFDRVGLR